MNDTDDEWAWECTEVNTERIQCMPVESNLSDAFAPLLLPRYYFFNHFQRKKDPEVKSI